MKPQPGRAKAVCQLKYNTGTVTMTNVYYLCEGEYIYMKTVTANQLVKGDINAHVKVIPNF